MKRLAIIALALALGAPDLANAQTATQWSQLVAYVGKLANRMLEQQVLIETLRAENEQQRLTINQTIAALDNERCRISRLNTAVKDYTASNIKPTWVDNVSCIDLKSPVPPFPAPLSPVN